MDRNFTKIAVLLCLVWCCASQLFAQDIHYTQFYDSPLNLNPALAGHIEGKYRVNLMYRSQWGQIASTGPVYLTPSASFDINFGKSTQSSSWGLGAVIVNDQTSGGLSTLEALLGAAYHFNIDGRETNYISGGFQAGLVQKRIDRGKLTFGNQFDPTTGEFDTGTNVETGLNLTDLTYPDVRVGLAWATYLENITFKAGVSYMHLLGGAEGFIAESDLPARLVVHADVKANVTKNIFIRPNVLYMTQAKASQLNVGSHLGYAVSNNFSIYAGAGLRMDDALITVIGFEAMGIRLGLMMDATLSPFSDVSTGIDAYEISLSYTGAAANRAKPLLPAIRFFD